MLQTMPVLIWQGRRQAINAAMPLRIGRLSIMVAVSERRALSEAEGGKLATHHKNGALRQLKESSTDGLSLAISCW